MFMRVHLLYMAGRAGNVTKSIHTYTKCSSVLFHFHLSELLYIINGDSLSLIKLANISISHPHNG